MSAFLLIAASFALGLLLRRAMPAGSSAALNAWIIDIALPALVLLKIPQLHFSPALVFPALAPWLVFAGAWLLLARMGALRNWPRGTIGALVLTAGLGNTAFVGIALVEALRGSDAVGPAVVADQLGTFLALSTGGIGAAAYYAGASVAPRDMAARVLRFPPFIALCVAALAGVSGGWPPLLVPVLQRLADTLVPLALFSVGLQFQLRGIGDDLGRMSLAMAWKLALAPALVAACGYLSGVGGHAYAASVLQCAMAPMVSAGILAEYHGLDPKLANRMVSLGTVLSFATVPLWSLML
ncbi:MAG TPA: AEC family transporter [Nevskiaceae bacterium]|nr:AEC family transporter [Nevskiaceae bacterium]